LPDANNTNNLARLFAHIFRTFQVTAIRDPLLIFSTKEPLRSWDVIMTIDVRFSSSIQSAPFQTFQFYFSKRVYTYIYTCKWQYLPFDYKRQITRKFASWNFLIKYSWYWKYHKGRQEKLFIFINSYRNFTSKSLHTMYWNQ